MKKKEGKRKSSSKRDENTEEGKVELRDGLGRTDSNEGQEYTRGRKTNHREQGADSEKCEEHKTRATWKWKDI